VSTVNLPTDLLRTFVTVIDLGGYTRAGDALGRTQPAISLQMNRLQDLLETKLLEQKGRSLELTEAGSALAAFARQILHLNDEAVARFKSPERQGVLRIGLPTDFAVSKLQATVAAYVDEHPDVDLEVSCGLSLALFDDLHKGELDLIIALIGEKTQQYLVRVWEDQPIWVAKNDFNLNPDHVVPIVGHPTGCEYRNRMTDALSSVNRDWRFVYTSPDVSGLQYAVGAGLGVSAMTYATLDDEMRILCESEGFPLLKPIRIGLFYKLPNMSAAGLELSNRLIDCLDRNTDQHFKAAAHPSPRSRFE
jgi:DNA-binding transcriptional LysR family regulator